LEEIKLKAKQILSKAFNVAVKEIPEDAALESYEKWDSLGHMRMILELEVVIDRTIETEELLAIFDFDSLVELISKK